uniref:Peptidase A1 domain-containing protein n=1 Tax=Araucaria cunninghamii TaxID=56994 RepID=A0A0D6QS88_ARACU
MPLKVTTLLNGCHLTMERYCLFGLILVIIVLCGAQQQADGLQVKMKMIHRHSTHSPFYTEFTSRFERIHELLRLDSLRIRSTPRWKFSFDNQPSAAPSPGQEPRTSFAMPLASGATLGSALYFVELYIGTPPQRALLVADTGSDLIWVNCHACRNCSSANSFPVFSPDNSSSLSYVPCFSRECNAVSPNSACVFKPKIACKYSYGYLDNSSTTGPYIRDTITLKSMSGRPLKAEKVYMGCGTDNQGQSEVGSGGVLGLGQGFNSFASQTANLYGSKFSYCLRDYLQPPTVRSSLVFGDTEDSLLPTFLKEPIVYTPILKEGSSFYYVGIEDITVNGEKLPISSSVWEVDEAGNGGTIIDSGSSLTYFTEDAYGIIMEALRVSTKYPMASTASPQRFDLCFNTSGGSNLKFPEFSIGLSGGRRFTPPAENFMLEIEDDVKCVGFSPLRGQSIIGNLLQQNFFFEYDRRRSLLGFAPANCSAHN